MGMQVDNMNQQFPVVPGKASWFDNADLALKFATQDQNAYLKGKGAQCEMFVNGKKNEQNDPQNCAKLNSASAHFDHPPMKITQATGSYDFVNTRDNNFSNRSTKLRITVGGKSEVAKALEATAIAGGVSIAVIILFALGYFLYCWKLGRVDKFWEHADMAKSCCCYVCCC